MSSLKFSNTVMNEIRAAMRSRRAPNTPLAAPKTALGIDDVVMGDDQLDRDLQATPCQNAKKVFENWLQDLDDQTLPEMDSEELRILHALLFGTGDDAFAVADELLKLGLGAEAA